MRQIPDPLQVLNCPEPTESTNRSLTRIFVGGIEEPGDIGSRLQTTVVRQELRSRPPQLWVKECASEVADIAPIARTT